MQVIEISRELQNKGITKKGFLLRRCASNFVKSKNTQETFSVESVLSKVIGSRLGSSNYLKGTLLNTLSSEFFETFSDHSLKNIWCDMF